MASRAPAADTRYRTAFSAGARGAQMPEGLASEATRDPALDKMHDAGRSGADYDEALRTHAPHAVRAPRRPAQQSAPSEVPARSGAGLRGALSSSPAEAGAGVLLGMVAYALVLSIVTHGAQGPLLWFKAKFLNETPTTASASSPVRPGTVIA